MANGEGDAPAYEMLWDCRQCGSEGLLGLTHRYCPGCGAPQDPAWRYFPKDEDKVAIADHKFTGIDKVCPACDTPNGARSGFCMSCGGPLDGAKVVQQQSAVAAAEAAGKRKPAAAPPPVPPAGGGSKKAGFALGGVFGCGTLFAIAALLIIAFVAVAWFWRSGAAVTVQRHAWERTIEVETFREVNEDGWCDEMPAGTRASSRTPKKRSTRDVPDGQTCVTKNVDRGDGTFTQKEDCKTKYRKEDVMGDHCTWAVQRWQTSDTRRANGGLDTALAWPAVSVTGCAQLGCTREGKRNSTFTVSLKAEESLIDCTISDEAKWRGMAVGSAWTLPMSAVTGQAFCADLSPR